MHRNLSRKSSSLVIAVDGPAGSGKSTVSKRIAKALGLLYIDTGAMYRALTLKAIRQNLDLEDERALVSLAGSTKIDLEEANGVLKVHLDGEDVAGFIRTPELTKKVKYIARVPGVRQEMVKLQRAIGERTGAVLEGRDIGTVVFPDASFKFYLDADVEERARRRYKELTELGQKVSREDIKKDVVLRDESDMKRSVGALKKADGAIIIDTTNLSVDEAVKKILRFIKCGTL
ncbi:MAG: (d)CMP kinase [Candidatus Omnitrophica bacterium]|nr:(d)CMP kinase [Candidatus Omnitrophota bacterium]